MHSEIQQFLSQKRTRLSPQTVKAYESDLNRFCAFLQDKSISEVTAQHIESFLKHIQDSSVVRKNAYDKSANTARKLSTTRSFFKYLHRNGFIELDPTLKVEPIRVSNRVSEFLSPEEKQRLLEAIKRTATPYYIERDMAIVQTFLYTGIRLRELVSLKVTCLDFEGQCIKVVRKGGDEDKILLPNEAAKFLKAYLEVRPKSDIAYVFVSKRKRVTKDGYGISPSEVYLIIQKYLRKAGITKEHLGVHSLRHTFATDLLRLNANLVQIKELLGHKNIATTQRYVHVEEKDLRKIINQL
ncbi:MAG: tyrosine-type recombinase/integrase [Candidatus Kerfeldbacteria bacterium]|nr:tyrosine-type recombinase/integrase [Candidatus Kerfeldbacteria bacterium]